MSGKVFDYLGEEFIDDPYPVFARMRRDAPVYHHPGTNLWSVFRYEDIRPLLSDFETFSSVVSDGLPDGDGGKTVGRGSTLSAIDPPDHTRLRAVISEPFKRKSLDVLATNIREICIELIEAAKAKGKVDLIDSLTFELPMMVVTDLIGLPRKDSGRMRFWSEELSQSQFRGIGEQKIPPEKVASRQQVTAELEPYFREAIMARRQDRGEDLISTLLDARERGEVQSVIELVSTVGLLLVAGLQTTQHLFSNAIVLLSERPKLQKQLRRNPQLIPSAVGEVLRFESPVTARLRRTTRDLKIGDVAVPKDATILWWISSANRDVSKFPNPDEFDPARHPNRHLAFGHGIHYCLGGNLGRLEASIALEELLARTDSIQLDGDGPWIRTEPFGFRGVSRLPVTLA